MALMVYNWVTEEQINALKNQCRTYKNIANNSNISNSNYSVDDNGQLFLEEGTLLHGTDYDEGKLKSIAKYGIVACEFFGKEEDAETFYCADFYRIKKSTSIKDYVNFCMEPDILNGLYQSKIEKSRLPLDNISYSISFVINNNTDFQPLLDYDPYRDNSQSIFMRTVVAWENIGSDPRFDHDRLAAIFCGMPANAISGILVNNRIKNDSEKTNFLITAFPNCYIATIEGEIIYSPEKSVITMNNITYL